MRLAQFGEICYTASHVGRSEGQIRLDVLGSPGDRALGSDGFGRDTSCIGAKLLETIRLATSQAGLRMAFERQ